LAVPVDADYIFIWGVKGKFFWRGIDWTFLESPHHTNLHPSYPVLTPLVYDVHALVAGAWPDRWIGLVTTICGIAGLLVIRAALAEEMGTVARAAATAILVPIVLSPYIGLAEGPQSARSPDSFICAMVLPIAQRLHAVFFGLAPRTKTKDWRSPSPRRLQWGQVASERALALLPRRGPVPWPSVVIPTGCTTCRRASRTVRPAAGPHLEAQLIARAVVSQSTGTPLFWIGIAAALAIGFRRLPGGRFLAAIGVQLFVLSAISSDRGTWSGTCVGLGHIAPAAAGGASRWCRWVSQVAPSAVRSDSERTLMGFATPRGSVAGPSSTEFDTKLTCTCPEKSRKLRTGWKVLQNLVLGTVGEPPLIGVSRTILRAMGVLLPGTNLLSTRTTRAVGPIRPWRP
jgi:hypothetical protein